jgi:two-component system, cell cycle response regulator
VSAGATTVLVADDQASFRDRLVRLLRDAGFEVLVAFDGAQALRMCKSEQPDLALLDVIMPKRTGIEVCQELRADDQLPYIPVLFLSRRAEPAQRAAGLRAGADDFLAKPWDDDELIARIESALRIKRLIDRSRAVGSGPGPGPADGRDPTTGLCTEELFRQRIETELERALRANEPLSLMLIATDGGSPRHLADMAAALQRGTGDQRDLVAHCLPATLAVLMHRTHFAGALARARRAWHELSHLAVEGQLLQPTIGVACYPNGEVESGSDLIDFALSALRRARAEGPAHICLYQHQAYIFQPE